jgi:hypothetical protein
MKLTIRNQPDFYSGALFTVVGAGFVLAARRYEFGSAAQMGPAQFPLILGSLLALLGVIVAVRSLTPVAHREGIAPISVRPFALVLGSVALFGVLLMPLGLIISSLVLVALSALASHEFHWKYATVTAFALVIACYLIFVYGLGLPMPVLPGGL